MAIPHFDDLRKPILDLLSDGNEWRKADLVQPLAKHFNLTDEEINQEYQSGNGSIFIDRISWALSYFALTDLLSRPKRGSYVINDFGKTFLNKSNAEINQYVKQKMAERQAENPSSKENDDEIITDFPNTQNTPQEQLYSSYKTIRQNIYDEILDTILSKTPMAFEKLVVELLQRMGYGGAIENSATITQYSRDNGIDGVIKEDVLGFDKILIQAKRYQLTDSISQPDIQAFAGAILQANCNKGVFITTAKFSKNAIGAVQNLAHAKIVLIDGQKLAEYMYHYGLGVQVEQTLSIKKLDNDYWDNMPNDEKI
ncbi:restriction endonuclease [Moraxella sp.]|uniref:restriction endonuclease n=1 Tax=Moraxella sp. TaxID=479 RepID=UPI0026DBB1F1|nr:restriction endonuclease [Moraxella sp.]MDO4895221.1 restriction endonuclease [Moraxella sp.]